MATKPNRYPQMVRDAVLGPSVEPETAPGPAVPPPPPPPGIGPGVAGPAKTPYSEQAVRDSWASTQDHSNANLATIGGQYGLQTEGDTLILPDGRRIDAVMDEGGRNDPGWLDLSQGDRISRGSQGADSGMIGRARSGAGGGALGAGAAAGGAMGAGSAFQNSIRAMLLEQLGKMGKDPSIDDPALQNQSRAFRAAQDRAGGNERAALAERAAFQGLNAGGQGSGSFDTGVQGIHERIGQNTAAHDAGLVGAEAQNRRGHLQNLLQLALASGDSESARAVQMQMAQMDQAIRQATLAQQSSQFDDRLGFDLGRSNEDDFRFRTNLSVGG